MRASAFEDSLGLIADYTQGTNANKPLYSRADNKGNLLRNSHNVVNWTNYVGVGTPVGPLVTANAGTGARGVINTTTAFYSNMAIAGINLRLIVEVEYVNYTWCWIGNGGDSSWRGVRFNLLTGLVDASFNITSSSVETVSAGRYKITILMPIATTSNFSCYVTFGTSTIANGSTSITAAGTEQIKIHYGVGQQESWDAEPLETTDYPQYAGVNGQKWLVCNGAQALVNTDVTSDIFAAGTKLAYIPIQSFLLNVSQNIFRDTAGNFFTLVASSGSNYSFSNNDGGTDVVTASATLVTSILRFRQTGGNIYLAVDSGAGYVESAPVASGDTADLSSTIQIGRTANGFYGKIGGILTANTGVPKPNLERLLRESVFARSLLKYDPINCKLGLGRY
jgi:hypothetical protein